MNAKRYLRAYTLKTYKFIAMALLFAACTPETFNSKEALWKYLKNPSNGYFQEKTINGYQFSLVHRPTDLLVLQELTDKTDEKKIESLRRKYQQNLYFNLSMSRDNKELLSTTPKNRAEFSAMVNQLAFGMGSKIALYNQQQDTLPLMDYSYPRMYGMSRSTTMMFVYPRDPKKLKGTHLNFTIQDLGTYTGEVRFKIPIKKLRKEPRLNL
jgi:hypothetical protein